MIRVNLLMCWMWSIGCFIALWIAEFFLIRSGLQILADYDDRSGSFYWKMLSIMIDWFVLKDHFRLHNSELENLFAPFLFFFYMEWTFERNYRVLVIYGTNSRLHLHDSKTGDLSVLLDYFNLLNFPYHICFLKVRWTVRVRFKNKAV